MKQIEIKKTLLATAVVTLATLPLTACNDNDDKSKDSVAAGTYQPVTLNIGHINDHHSHLEAEGEQEFTMDGNTYEIERGGFARIKSLYDHYANAFANQNFLKLHSGDAMTGTEYYSFYKGKADADLMNTVCFDAFALGNHEFDDSDANLKTFIDNLHAGSCKTPVLGANVVPKVGTPLAPNTTTDYIKPYYISETKEGVKVGIIGLDIASKTTKSSQPLDTTQFLDETETAQKYIDELKAKGIEHIILLTHYTYAGDQKLAKSLSGVDVIIGGDSHTLLGDFSAYGKKLGQGDYPTITTNKNGETVCIGQAWEYTKAFGLMRVQFNDKGSVSSCHGSAIIPVGDTVTKLNTETKDFEAISAEESLAVVNKLSARHNNLLKEDLLVPIAENQTAVNALAVYKNQLSDKLAESIGKTSEALCLIRIPGGKNRSSDVEGCADIAEMARGSDAAQVVAESFLEASKRADFALQNAGGVRIPLPAGNITNKTAYALLPFSNTLVNFDITGEQIHNTLEEAIANHMNEDGSSGSHPYAAGLRWDLDLSKAKGERISNIEAKDRKTGTWSALDKSKTYVMVTNNYIGGGKDGYTTLGEISKDASKVEDTKLLYTQSFIDHVTKLGTIARPAREEYSHKSVITKDGKVLK